MLSRRREAAPGVRELACTEQPPISGASVGALIVVVTGRGS